MRLSKKSYVITLLVFAIIAALAGCAIWQQPEARSSERIGILGTQGDTFVTGWNGSDMTLYSDAGTTQKWSVDGATGNVDQEGSLDVASYAKLAVPTAVATATPGMLIDSAAVSALLELRKAATPVFQVNGSGNVDAEGTLNIAGASTLTGNVSLGGTLSVTGASTLTGTVSTGGDLTVGNGLILTAQTAITVTDGAAFAVTGSYQPIQAASEVTPTITIPAAGTVVTLINVSNQTINIADTGNQVLSAAWAGGQYDTLTMISDGTRLIEISRSDN